MEFKNENFGVTREEEQECGETIWIEKGKVGIMRSFVEREDPSSKVFFDLHFDCPSSLINLAPLLYLNVSMSGSTNSVVPGPDESQV